MGWGSERLLSGFTRTMERAVISSSRGGRRLSAGAEVAAFLCWEGKFRMGGVKRRRAVRSGR